MKNLNLRGFKCYNGKFDFSPLKTIFISTEDDIYFLDKKIPTIELIVYVKQDGLQFDLILESNENGFKRRLIKNLKSTEDVINYLKYKYNYYYSPDAEYLIEIKIIDYTHLIKCTNNLFNIKQKMIYEKELLSFANEFSYFNRMHDIERNGRSYIHIDNKFTHNKFIELKFLYNVDFAVKYEYEEYTVLKCRTIDFYTHVNRPISYD